METTVSPRAHLTARPARLKFFSAAAHILPHWVVACIVVIGALFVHELGHALVAQFFGARVVMFNVFGVQWFPKLEWLPQFGFGGYVYWFAPVNLTHHRLIVFAGSTLTLLFAILAVILLNTTRAQGLFRTALAVMTLYFVDSLAKIVPVLGFMPPGWGSRFTRSFSEAYFAAVALGMPREVYIGAIFGISLLCMISLVRALRR